MPNVIAQVGRIGIRRVLTPFLPCDLKIANELVVGLIEQRAHHDIAATRNRRQTRCTRTPQRVHQERLGTIGRRVSCKDAGRRTRRSRALGELVHLPASGGIAHLARRGLKILPVKLLERSVFHTKRHPQALAERADKGLIPIGFGTAQMMVHMQNADPLARDPRKPAPVHDVELSRAGHQQQRGRVRAA